MEMHKNGDSASQKNGFDPIKILSTSGHRCPCNGTWETLGKVKTVRILAKDQITPTYLGQIVTWRLLRRG